LFIKLINLRARKEQVRLVVLEEEKKEEEREKKVVDLSTTNIFLIEENTELRVSNT